MRGALSEDARVVGVAKTAELGLYLMCLMSGFWAAVSCAGQEGVAAASAPGAPYTLHVYEDLLQVPTLVLNTLHGSYHGLKTGDFSIRLDSGPAFHPAHLRTQGDEPLSLAVLMDDSPAQGSDLSQSLQAAVAHLPADVFGPEDRVSVFAFDCTLVRSALAASVTRPVLEAEIGAALQGAGLHTGSKENDRCQRHIGLWDAIGEVAAQMRELPGRRVLMLLTDGADHGSRNSWEAVRRYANTYSIAVFGLRPPLQPVEFALRGIHSMGQVVIEYEDRMGLLCGGTGGLSLTSSPQTLDPMMRRIVEFVRNRYILEFPRPANATAGYHDIAVAVKDRTALVRVSGVTFPLQDQLLLKDPSTVPADSSKLPVLGTRGLLTQHP